MGLNEALQYGAGGAATGAAFGPWGAGIGAGVGALYGLFGGGGGGGGGTTITVPVLNKDTGVGSGYGYTYGDPNDPRVQGAIAARTDWIKPMVAEKDAAIASIDAQMAALQSQNPDVATMAMSPLTASSDPNALKYLQLKQQRDAAAGERDKMTAQLNEGLRPTDLDTFSAQAAGSYDRQAPTLAQVAPDMDPMLIDRSRFDSGGKGMEDLTTTLRNDMSGNAPSLAQAQLAQATAANVAQQQSAAASAGPMDYAAARRAAILGGAAAQQQASMQSAQIRAQEYAQARGELGNVLTNKRAQQLQAMGLDADTAMKQAQFEATQNMNRVGLQQNQNQLNQQREGMYLGAYQDAQDRRAATAYQNQNAKMQGQGMAVDARAADRADRAETRSMIGATLQAAGNTMQALGYGGSGSGSSSPAPTLAPTPAGYTSDPTKFSR